MPLDEDLEAWLRLSLVPGLAATRCASSLRASAIRRRILAPRAPRSRATCRPRSPQRSHGTPPPTPCARGERAGSKILQTTSSPSPTPTIRSRLLQIADPPPLLYVKGRANCCSSRRSRSWAAATRPRRAWPTPSLRAGAERRRARHRERPRARDRCGGPPRRARGRSSSSIAVVGTGLDIVYPARNRALAHELAERGVLVSEFPLGTPALPANFPRRNRLISGLARGCLVVEAAAGQRLADHGARALEQGREVFAMPGSIHSPLAKGCHALIKQGAKLVESAHDVLEELHLPACAAQATPGAALSPARSRRGCRRACSPRSATIRAISTRWPRARHERGAKLAALLTQLEIEGWSPRFRAAGFSACAESFHRHGSSAQPAPRATLRLRSRDPCPCVAEFLVTYHLALFSIRAGRGHEQSNSSSPRNLPSPTTSRARSAVSRDRTTTSRATTTCCRRRWDICSSCGAPEEHDRVRGAGRSSTCP